MQKQKSPEATKTVYPILRQIVNLIPPSIFHVCEIGEKRRKLHGVGDGARGRTTAPLRAGDDAP